MEEITNEGLTQWPPSCCQGCQAVAKVAKLLPRLPSCCQAIAKAMMSEWPEILTEFSQHLQFVRDRVSQNFFCTNVF